MAEYIDREKIREETCKGCVHRTGKDGCGWPEPCEKLIGAFLNAEPSDITYAIDPETLPIVKQLRAELTKVKAEKDEYKELFFSYKHVCGGIAPQRIGELVEADKDGRCVVFPCRPSDVTVYQLRNKKHARGIGVHPRHIHCATVWADGKYEFEHQGMEPCKGKDLGKTWFLTEEAAEAALAKEEGQCDVK